MADENKPAWTMHAETETAPHKLEADKSVTLRFVIEWGGGGTEPPQTFTVNAIANRRLRDAGLSAHVLDQKTCVRREGTNLFDGKLKLSNAGETDELLIVEDDVSLTSMTEEVDFKLSYPIQRLPGEVFPPDPHVEGDDDGKEEDDTSPDAKLKYSEPTARTRTPKVQNDERPAPPPSPAAWKWALGVGTATVAIVVLASWFFQVTWGATIGAIAMVLAAIWVVNALRTRVTLTGNHIAALIAAAVFVLICVGWVKLLIVPSTEEEEAAASTSDAANENEAAETDAVSNVVVPPSAPPKAPPVETTKPVEPAPASVTGVAAAPPAPPAPPASLPAPKPAAPAAEKPPEPKGPLATLPNTDTCEALLRPNDFPQGGGKYGAVCGEGDQRGVYRVDSTEKVGGKNVHTDLTLLPGVKPPAP